MSSRMTCVKCDGTSTNRRRLLRILKKLNPRTSDKKKILRVLLQGGRLGLTLAKRSSKETLKNLSSFCSKDVSNDFDECEYVHYNSTWSCAKNTPAGRCALGNVFDFYKEPIPDCVIHNAEDEEDCDVSASLMDLLTGPMAPRLFATLARVDVNCVDKPVHYCLPRLLESETEKLDKAVNGFFKEDYVTAGDEVATYKGGNLNMKEFYNAVRWIYRKLLISEEEIRTANVILSYLRSEFWLLNCRAMFLPPL